MEAVHLQGFAHREAPEPTIEGQPEPALPVIPGKEQVVPVLGPQIGDWKVESAHDLVVPFPVTAGPGEPEIRLSLVFHSSKSRRTAAAEKKQCLRPSRQMFRPGLLRTQNWTVPRSGRMFP